MVSELERLAGTWTCVSAVNDGKPLPDDVAKELHLTITKEGGYTMQRGDQVLFDSKCLIDPARNPKHIDLIGTAKENKGKASQGLYALEDDTLTICYTVPGLERPSKLESKPDSAATLVAWKRKEP